MGKYSTQYLNNTFQNSHDYQKQGKTEKLSKIGGDSGDMMTKQEWYTKMKLRYDRKLHVGYAGWWQRAPVIFKIKSE